MNWFFIALGAPFLWALANLFDQYLVNKYTNNRRSSVGALVLFSSLFGIIIAFPLLFFIDGIFNISFLDKLLLTITGIFTILWVILYLFAIRIEKISNIVPIFLTIPIFGYIFGYLFLGEDLLFFQKIGSLIILFGVILLSFDFSNKEKTHFKWKVLLYMIPACFLIAVIGIIFKYITIAGDFWVSSFWVNFGLSISGIFIFIFISSYRYEFFKMIKRGGIKIFSLNLASEVISSIGNMLTNYATLLAPLAMVYLVGNFQPAILLILTLFCTKFFPQITIENISKRILFPKIISILIIILGSVVLFF
ncbi:MAG: DMT family transporter [Patescibacteria group bacterium]